MWYHNESCVKIDSGPKSLVQKSAQIKKKAKTNNLLQHKVGHCFQTILILFIAPI